jgi:hypothetical protein
MRTGGKRQRTRSVRIGFVNHRTPPKDGERRVIEVPVKYIPHMDLSRYPGFFLRAIRASKTNFLGELRR